MRWEYYSYSKKHTISYKKIPSHIVHKSPDAYEIKSQIEARSTPNLSIDRDRYIDFISAKWNYKKINYPYLYRLKPALDKFDITTLKNELKNYLNKTTIEINNIISSENPSSLSWKDLEIYNLLKKTNYNSSSIDLYNYIKNKPDTTYSFLWDSKNQKYIDVLTFSIYWIITFQFRQNINLLWKIIYLINF